MSIFNELILPKLLEISNNTAKNFNQELQTALDCLQKFEDEHLNRRGNAKEKAQRDKTLMTTLQIINENDGESNVTPETAETDKPADNGKRRVSKKRSKDEVEGMSSPEQDKRAKRSASVKAQSIISKQDKEREILKVLNEDGVAFVSSEVNVNLTQKLRRDDSADKKSRRRKEDDKENEPIIPPVQIKQEKISLLSEPMETESVALDLNVKQEPTDEIAMPPPTAPVPKPRKALQKEKEKQKETEENSEEEGGKRRNTRTRKQTDTVPLQPEPRKALQKEKESEENSEDEGGKRRNTRTRKQTDTVPLQPVSSARATRASRRASSRATKLTEDDMPPAPPADTRPKRTRGRKKASTSESDKKSTQTNEESAPTSPAEKPRPKRTRRGKNAEKEAQKPEEQNDQEKFAKDQEKFAKDQEKFAKDQEKFAQDQEQFAKDQDKFSKDQIKATKDNAKTMKSLKEAIVVLTKDERISQPESPILQKNKEKPVLEDKKNKKGQKNGQNQETSSKDDTDSANHNHITIEDSKILSNMNVTVTLTRDLDKTVVLPNGVYNHAPVTPSAIHANETVVLESHARETMVLDKHNINDATVVLEKEPKQTNMTEDNSLLTDDASEPEARTPPCTKEPPQPTSAVKEKVQQFEELAARTTRTKTRAMAKIEDVDNHTPPDKMIKPGISADTLSKMNNMIFNGKPPQISNSASKPTAFPPTKPQTASTSKLSALHKHREAAEREREKEDARKKKEAMLEAKRELQKKKREEKMANAAAAREAADRERQLAMEALARERQEKQLHASQGKLHRLKEVERKKQELARKVAETEERRKAEEAARVQRLADEQRKAELARKKQLEEAEQMKKEAVLMAKEIEMKQKEYLEKQKLKQKLESEKLHIFKTPNTPKGYPQEPVYMQDGFQHLNSDEEDSSSNFPVPSWSSSKARRLALSVQSCVTSIHIDKLFSVRVHSPDLREIFPNIERNRLKRTSSAVWRTPPRLPPLQE